MYPKINGDEIYDTNTYKTDFLGNEIYATLKNGSEKYLQINEFDIMAKKSNLRGEKVPYFALDKFKHPICPRLKHNMMYLELDIPYPRNSHFKELYPKLNNKEYYIGKNEKCRYAKNETQEDYYATNENKMYYAFEKDDDTGDLIEFPTLNKKGEEIYITENDLFMYPFNLTKLQPIYPIDSESNEFYYHMNNRECFAIRNNTPYYAKNNKGHDILPFDTRYNPYYIFYILNEKKYEIYPKKNNEEYYLAVGYYEIYAKKGDDQYYAKKENDDDYFATDYQIPYYAVNHDNVEIYPSNNLNNNFYKIHKKIEILACDNKTRQGYFAKDFYKNEFYPKSFQDEKMENVPKVEVKKNYDFIEPSLTDITTHEASVK